MQPRATPKLADPELTGEETYIPLGANGPEGIFFHLFLTAVSQITAVNQRVNTKKLPAAHLS